MTLRNRVAALESKVKHEEPEELTYNEKQLLYLDRDLLNSAGIDEAARLRSKSAANDAYWKECLPTLTDAELSQLEVEVFDLEHKDIFGMPTLDSDPVYDPAYLNRYLRNPETFPTDIREMLRKHFNQLRRKESNTPGILEAILGRQAH